MGDREADIFELFEAKESAPENVHLVIRAIPKKDCDNLR